MINAGAISACGLVRGKTPDVRFQRILETLGHYAGRTLTLDKAVYESESLTGHRNRAIGHMLRNFDILEEDPMPVVDNYFKQCSIAVTCRDLGVMAATLANRGVNPLTGRQALRGEYVESVLSVMGSCGMYDYAGSWIYQIGMPAKSGVSGGIIAILPGQLGIGVFSPLLDDKGNSVRGIRVCDELSRYFDLHLFNRPSSAQSAVRACYSGSHITSRQVRSREESQLLHEMGEWIRVYQLQDNLAFVTTEVLVQEVMSSLKAVRHVILDLRRVLTLNESSCRLIYQMLESLHQEGKTLLFTHADRFPLLRRYMRAKMGGEFEKRFRVFEDNDLAMEWCENRLLDEAQPGRAKDIVAQGAQYELLKGLTPEEILVLEKLFTRCTFHRGEIVVKAGDDADHLYLVARGTASVMLEAPTGARKRLATFSAGMAFGEMAVMDRAPRSATVVADAELECDLLHVADFEKLALEEPGIKIKLMQNLCLSLCQKLRKTNRELSVFE
jgi:glutaminase